MTVVYVGGPYSAPDQWAVESNVRKAEALALAVWRLGAVPICPHTMTRFYDGTLPRATWLQGDLELLHRSDALVLVPGWEESAGTRAEIDAAARLGLPIFENLDTLVRWLEEQRENWDRQIGLPL